MELVGIINYILFIFILAGIYAFLVLGLNIQWGLSGLFNVGIAGFFAIGAYTFGILSGAKSQYYIGGWELPVFIGAIGSMLSAAILAWGIGKMCLKLRSDYLAIATIGLAEVIRLILKTEVWLSGGPSGITGIPRPFGDFSYMGSQIALRNKVENTKNIRRKMLKEI